MKLESQHLDVKNLNDSTDAVIIDHRKRFYPRPNLSFEDICPQWSLALATGVSTNSCLDIKEGKYCIVGEAHGFRNSSIICSKCWEHSQSFVASVYGNSRSGYIITDHELFEFHKDAFLKHFTQKHAHRKDRTPRVIDNAQRILRNIRSCFSNYRHPKMICRSYLKSSTLDAQS
jgi:hypothetical protein